jgi:hypothetical protein
MRYHERDPLYYLHGILTRETVLFEGNAINALQGDTHISPYAIYKGKLAGIIGKLLKPGSRT